MADLTKYNGLLAWRTIAKDVFQLTRATIDSPGTYRLTVKAEDTNDKGHGQKDITCWFTDYLGSPYSIIAVDTNTIDVSDVFQTGYCPTSGKTGYIHKSAYKGNSIALPSHAFRHLSSLAASNNNKFAMSILWANDSNAKEIELDPAQVPIIIGYQEAQEDGTNLAEDYGNKASFSLWQVLSTTQKIERTEKPNIIYTNETDKLIDTVDFGDLGEVMEGLIIKISQS